MSTLARINQDPLGEMIAQQYEISRNMMAIYNKVVQVEENVDAKLGVIKQVLQEVQDSVHLTRAESSQLKRAVETKSKKLALQWIGGEPDSKQQFNEHYRKVISRVWRKTKEFGGDVGTYPEIRRVDFEKVMEFVSTITLSQIAE